MNLLYNNGTQFFSITSMDMIGQKNVTKIISQDVISFSVTDELGKIPSGSLTIRDNEGMYSRIFRCGVKFEIVYGYRSFNIGNITQGINIGNARGNQRSLRCVVQTPSGSGDEGGQHIYSANFFGLALLDSPKRNVFDSGTRRQVVTETLRDLDILDYTIDFKDAGTRLSIKNIIIQSEPPTGFLYRLAKEWNCIFFVCPKKDGTKFAFFLDVAKVASPMVKAGFASSFALDDTKDIYYNSGQLSNVRSFDWQQHIGESGQGDGVNIMYVEGKAIYTRYVAQSSGTVRLYRLDEEKVRKATNNGQNAETSMEILNAKNFEQVKKYFTPCDSKIAPQGMGYTVNCKMKGDPFMTVLMKIKFKGGFPAPLTQSIPEEAYTKFYIKKTVHSFSKGEYNTDVEIVDSYTLNGSFIAPATQREAMGNTAS